MTSPALSSARAAGPFSEMLIATTLLSISVSIHAEPGSRRFVDATELAQIIQHRLEQIDRHDHVDMLVFAVALAFELERSDADQLDDLQISAAPPQLGCAGWVKIASSSKYSQ